jgi:serine/threonine protein phosphatase 1
MMPGMRRVGAEVTPTLPKGQLVYAVGDIHGRLDLLRTLLRRIAGDARQSPEAHPKTLVFLGDYVDRGPDSCGVVETLIGGLPDGFETHFLKGNHEALLLDFLGNPLVLAHWLINGGDATMASYGVDVDRLERSGAAPEIWRSAFAAALPEPHLRFFRSLKLGISIGDYLFVHAGVRPGVPIAAQDEADLIWIRREFLDCLEPFGKIVVHGHTPEKAPQMRPNRIGIDTGAFFTGRLTALRLEDGAQSFLQT